MTNTYTFTIFDADPQTSGSCAWDAHTDVEIEADDNEEAVEQARDELEIAACGLCRDDGYNEGQRIYALV